MIATINVNLKVGHPIGGFRNQKYWNKVASEVGGNGNCNHSTTS